MHISEMVETGEVWPPDAKGRLRCSDPVFWVTITAPWNVQLAEMNQSLGT